MLAEQEIERLTLYKRILNEKDLAEEEYVLKFSLIQEDTDNTPNLLMSMSLEGAKVCVTPARWGVEYKCEMLKVDGHEWLCKPIGHHIFEYVPERLHKELNKRLEECERRGIHLQDFVYAEEIRGEDACVVYTGYQQFKEFKEKARSEMRKKVLDPMLFGHFILYDDGVRKVGIRVLVVKWDAIH